MRFHPLNTVIIICGLCDFASESYVLLVTSHLLSLSALNDINLLAIEIKDDHCTLYRNTTNIQWHINRDYLYKFSCCANLSSGGTRNSV